MIEVRRADDRGVIERHWLSSRHTFSFGHYFDPKQVGFSDLLAINDDRVIGGRGFEHHAHRDVDIFSYILEGSLQHKDTLGNDVTIKSGEVQMMNAGTGIAHSELNRSSTEGVHFLQIWIQPERSGALPRYQNAQFPQTGKRGKLKLVISPDGQDGSVSTYQDVRAYAGLFHGAEAGVLELPNDRYAYVHVARGTVSINGCSLRDGDGARVRKETRLVVSDGSDSEILIFDLRPHETP